MSSGTSIKGYRPVLAERTGKLPAAAAEVPTPMPLDESTRKSKMAELLAAAEKMTPMERLFQPNPPWLRVNILGDLTDPLDDEDLPQGHAVDGAAGYLLLWTGSRLPRCFPSSEAAAQKASTCHALSWRQTPNAAGPTSSLRRAR